MDGGRPRTVAFALDTILAEFLADLIWVRRYSPHTVRAYGADVRAFCRGFSERHGRPPLVEDFCRSEVRAECARVFYSLKASSVARRLAALQAFGDHMVRRGLLADNEVRMMRRPRRPQHLVAVPSEAQLARLCEVNVGPNNIRDQAVVELLYGAGLRVSECVELDVESLYFNGDEVDVRVVGKGRRERQVPAGRAAASALRRVLAQLEWDTPRSGKTSRGKERP